MSGRWVYSEDERTKDLARMGFSVIRWTSKAKVLAVRVLEGDELELARCHHWAGEWRVMTPTITLGRNDIRRIASTVWAGDQKEEL